MRILFHERKSKPKGKKNSSLIITSGIVKSKMDNMFKYFDLVFCKNKIRSNGNLVGITPYLFKLV